MTIRFTAWKRGQYKCYRISCCWFVHGSRTNETRELERKRTTLSFKFHAVYYILILIIPLGHCSTSYSHVPSSSSSAPLTDCTENQISSRSNETLFHHQRRRRESNQTIVSITTTGDHLRLPWRMQITTTSPVGRANSANAQVTVKFCTFPRSQ